MAKKNISLLDELRDEPKTPRKTWFTKIDNQETKDQLLTLQEEYRNGEFGDITLTAAYNKCRERFGITIGVNQFCRWMKYG